MTDVYCYAEKVPETGFYDYGLGPDIFYDSYIEYATLHVPESAINDYMTTEPWNGFGSIKTLSGEEVKVEKCATPTIGYKEGKLVFGSETEGVEFISEITCNDIRKYYEAEVNLSATYTVSVYATKAGHDNSDTATAVLCWIACDGHGSEEEGDGMINIPATPVLIQCQGGTLTVNGLADDTPVRAYTTDGREVGNAVAAGHTATVQTSLQTGDIVIVNIGTKSVKMTVR